MKKGYVVKKNTTNTYTSTGGMGMSVPPSTEYSIVFKDEEDERIVASIPDYFQNPEGIAEGIAWLLNKGKINGNSIILPLEI